MASYNAVTIIGNLTRDPEVKVLPSGLTIAELNVAVNRKWKGKDGNHKEEVFFGEVKCFGWIAEYVGKTCQKGMEVVVAGRLITESWEGKDGGKRSKTRIIADIIRAIVKEQRDDRQFPTQPEQPAPPVPEDAGGY